MISENLSQDFGVGVLPVDASGDEYRLAKSAEALYERLQGTRQNVEDTVEELAEITIPSAFPPKHWQEGDLLYVPNQSVNSGAVSNWANVLAYTGFPPGAPMMSYDIIEHRLDDQEAMDPATYSKLELALSRLELAHRKRMAATILRTVYVQYLIQLCIAGNCLWRHLSLSMPTYHSMRHYVVQRDNLGRPLYVIFKESMSIDSLPADVRQIVANMRSQKARQSDNAHDPQTVDVYSVCRWEYPAHVGKNADKDAEGKWWYWQEIEGGVFLDGTEEKGDGDKIAAPLYPGWLVPRFGYNWGGSYCEEFRGDLYQVENDHHAMNDGSSIASWTLAMVDPSGLTSLETVREADNLDVIPGRANDVSFLQTAKGADFNIVANHADSAERRIARAFLMNMAIQRQGERVTKEEIVRMSQDIDRAVGGLHTMIAQTSQKHVLRRFLALHEAEDTSLPKLPEDIVRVSVITGVDSLGRSVEYQNLIEAATDASAVLTPAGLAGEINTQDFLRRVFAGKNVKPEGLVKSPEDKAAEQQQGQQQALMGEVAAPVAGEAAKAMFGGMKDMALAQQGAK